MIIADNFPDCYSLVKEKIIVSRLRILDDYLNAINATLTEYKEILNEETENYTNKLSHYAYINGLNTYDKPCEESYCSIPNYSSNKNQNNRRLNEDQNNNESFSFLFNTKINNSKEKKNINNKINFNRKLEEYTSSMGGLSENDLYKYLDQLLDTINKFKYIYLGEEFNNINRTVFNFIIKINSTYLEKLKRSFSMKIVKFSTILTEQSLKNLEKIILKQYYQIESYIHESSNLIQIKINEFLNEVNNTSLYIDSIKELINCRIRIQFEMLYQLIQSKYEIVQKDENKVVKIDKNKDDKSNIGKDDQNHPQVDPIYIGEDFKNNYGGTYDYIAKCHNFVEEK